MVVNPYFTLSKVDSIIYGQALSYKSERSSQKSGDARRVAVKRFSQGAHMATADHRRSLKTALGLGDPNDGSCPLRDLPGGLGDRLSWAENGRSLSLSLLTPPR
jgi:hypothetical protein